MKEEDSWTLPTFDNPDAAIHPSLLRPQRGGGERSPSSYARSASYRQREGRLRSTPSTDKPQRGPSNGVVGSTRLNRASAYAEKPKSKTYPDDFEQTFFGASDSEKWWSQNSSMDDSTADPPPPPPPSSLSREPRRRTKSSSTGNGGFKVFAAAAGGGPEKQRSRSRSKKAEERGAVTPEPRRKKANKTEKDANPLPSFLETLASEERRIRSSLTSSLLRSTSFHTGEESNQQHRRTRSSMSHVPTRRDRSRSRGRKPKTKSLESIILGDAPRSPPRTASSSSSVDWSSIRSLPSNLKCVTPERNVAVCRAPTGCTAPSMPLAKKGDDDDSAWQPPGMERLMSCVKKTDPMYESDDDQVMDDNSETSSKSVFEYLTSAWEGSFQAVKVTCEKTEKELSKSLFESFESLEVYAGSENLHEKLDDYLD